MADVTEDFRVFPRTRAPNPIDYGVCIDGVVGVVRERSSSAAALDGARDWLDAGDEEEGECVAHVHGPEGSTYYLCKVSKSGSMAVPLTAAEWARERKRLDSPA